MKGKIDLSYVGGIDDDATDEEIIDAIIKFYVNHYHSSPNSLVYEISYDIRHSKFIDKPTKEHFIEARKVLAKLDIL